MAMYNTYWNNKGEAQAMYDEMEKAGFKYTQKSLAAFRSYYRYFNDGDIPGWARGKCKLVHATYRCRYTQWELTEDGEKILEDRTTEAIRHKYKRFEKAIGRG